MTTAAYPNAVYLPYYMRRRERRNLTARQMDEADAIRQKLIDMARQDGYGVTYYTDANGKIRVFYNDYKKSLYYGGCLCSYAQGKSMWEAMMQSNENAQG